jgi:hypothetical protein
MAVDYVIIDVAQHKKSKNAAPSKVTVQVEDCRTVGPVRCPEWNNEEEPHKQPWVASADHTCGGDKRAWMLQISAWRGWKKMQKRKSAGGKSFGCVPSCQRCCRKRFPLPSFS